jgi:hypothetical protein
MNHIRSAGCPKSKLSTLKYVGVELLLVGQVMLLKIFMHIINFTEIFMNLSHFGKSRKFCEQNDGKKTCVVHVCSNTLLILLINHMKMLFFFCENI